MQRNGRVSVGEYSWPCACDWDGDGGRDLAIGNADGTPFLVEEVGRSEPPVFRPPRALETEGVRIRHTWADSLGQTGGERTEGYWGPAIVDWDGDGLDDLLAPVGISHELGNHRAIVRVSEVADAICAYLPWRRRDAHPEAKHVMVVDVQTGKVVSNSVVATCNREYGEIVFQPVSGAGDYYLYYLVPEDDVYGETWPRSSFPIIQYKRPQNRPAEAWLEEHGLSRQVLESTPNPADWHRPHAEVYAAAWRELPLAELVEFQSRGERHSFYPMEVVATTDERFELEHRCRFQPFILFPERRENPIRMTDAIPHPWAVRDEDERSTLSDAVLRNEYYVFQIGVYASKKLLHNLSVTFTDLETSTGALIPAEGLTCFNLGGVDQYGSDFEKSVHVETGRIQALWFGLDIPRTAEPGLYEGEVAVAADDQEPQTVTLALEVKDEVLEDRGDGDHWRLSRLRWLNSRIAFDDEVCAPFTALEVDGNTVDILGRRIEIDSGGMVKQATSFIDMFDICEDGRAVLREPVSFEVVCDGRTVDWIESRLTCDYARPGAVRYVATATSARLAMRAETTIEMDGFVGHRVTLESETPVPVDTVRLKIPFLGEASKYYMSSGIPSSNPEADELSCKTDFGQTPSAAWQALVETFEILWLGDYRAGLCLRIPPGEPGWVNEGRGRVRRSTASGGRLVTLDSGAQTIEGRARFGFELYVTPFKPLTREHWGWRHYHQAYGTEPVVEKGQEAGATIFTYHQGNQTNPHISYPFLRADRMKRIGDRIHAGGGLMKAYYTIRELSDRAAELWTLRSLGTEILPASGVRPGYEDFHLGYEELSQLPMEYQLRNQVSWPYTGYSWMCEHLVSGYHARWHTTVQMDDRTLIDASLQISGGSRWSNFYMEGLRWLMENAGLDGIYLDGITFDRESFKRVRKTLVRTKPEGLIDYHSHPTTIGQMPYYDRLWNGEGFDPGREAAYWLVAVSGAPFGVSGELLQSHAGVQRGMVFGVSQRYGWMSTERVDPSALWRWWDDFEIAKAEMLGYWQDACPVKTDDEAVKATAYVHRGERVAIAVASWAEQKVDVRIGLDWDTVGLDPDQVTVSVPAIDFFQDELVPVSLDSVPVHPDSGWIIVVACRS